MIARVRRMGGAECPPWIDLAFLSSRREVRGWGAARIVDVPAPWPDHLAMVSEVLAAVEVDGPAEEAGVGPVAFGALPFDRDASARFVIPTLAATLTPDGAGWLTSIDGAAPPACPHVTSPRSVHLRAATNEAAWMERVSEAVRHIVAGELAKVVLARRLDVGADVPFEPSAIASRLFAAQPASLRFAIDGLVGASPELLVSRIGDVVRAHPMAGTTPRSGDPAIDAGAAAALLASAKDRAEHQITIDAVHDALLPWCSYLDAEPEPNVTAAGAVQHLSTLVEGRLSHPVPSVLDLVAALHPTPAVGGWPRGIALKTISRLEPEGRGRYAGPVGWVDRHGNGAFAVGIRSIEVSGDGRHAAIHAGVGVVADSDPAAELAETRAKFRTTIPALLDL